MLGPARAGALLAWRFRIVRRPWLAAVTALIVLAAALLGLDARGLRTRLWSGAGQPRVESLAVLPLENLSGDAGQDYFADGMTEALSTDLARLGGVRRVIARGSAMRYKGSTKPLAEIARELRVDALITGAVLRAGDRVRITAQLIDPATGAQLWADRYERDLRDVLALQGEVTRAIADRIKAKLTTQEQARLVSAGPVNADAYDAYLKGLVHLYKQTQQDVDTALAYFQLARDKDPKFAPAYAGIARVWGWRAHLGRVPAREAYPEMNEAVMRAVALDDSLPEVHDALASLRAWFDWDWTAGEREYRRAIELNPSNAEARVFYSMILTCVGRPREGRAQIERALESDPHNSFFQWALGLQLLWERRYDEAIAQLRKALAIQPNSPDAQAFLVLALHQKGKYEEELAERKKRASPDVVEALNRGYAQGGYSGAMRMAAERLAARFHQGNLGATAVATHYALAGDKDRALEWLERGYEERTSQMVFLKVHPQWDFLRSDPRYQNLVRRMKFPN